MRTVGIICEYNPFHRGHAWLLAQLRERYGADTAVVCAMSGNFVQRGDFAIAEKHLRAEAALRGGADLVLELPLPWAISSAEGFARGGVEVLESTGVVDTLCFGSECADGVRVKRVAEGLLSEEFSTALRERLTDGGSFAAARQEAAQQILGDDAQILSAPNDILAVEYCKALRSMHSRMEPLALPRRGSAHDGEAQDGFASASYIRQKLIAGESADEYLTADMARLLAQACAAGRAPVRMETLERAVLYRLRTMGEEDFAPYDTGREGLYHRFYEAARSGTGVEQMLSEVKTRRYAHARLRRMLLSVFLGVVPARQDEEVPYLRVLGMNGRGRKLLHEMRSSARLPVLIKPADVRELSEAAQRLFTLEARCTDIYALAFPDPSNAAAGSEWRTGPIILDR